MARYPYFGVTRDQGGKLLPNATVSVYLTGTSTPASIYAASSGGAIINSVTSDSTGYYIFWVDTAIYSSAQYFKLIVSATNYQSKTYDPIIVTPNPASLGSVTDPWVDVRAYGAKGDGVTDDTAAFVSAFAVTNKKIIFPPGTFLLSSNLITQNTGFQDFEGAGPDSTTLLFTNAGDGITGAGSASFMGFTIKTNNTSAGIGLRLSGLQQIAEHIVVDKTGSGLWAIGLQAYGTVSTHIRNVYTKTGACTTGFDVVPNGSNAVGNLVFENVEMRGVTTGLHLGGTPGALSVSIFGGAIENCGTNGILIDGVGPSLAIYGTHFEQNTTNDINWSAGGDLSIFEANFVTGTTNALNLTSATGKFRGYGLIVGNSVGGNIVLGSGLVQAMLLESSFRGAAFTNNATGKVTLFANNNYDGTYVGNLIADPGNGFPVLSLQGATYQSRLRLNNSTGLFDITNNGIIAAQIDSNANFKIYTKLFPPTDGAVSQTSCGIYANTGAPNNTNGNNGDIYFRSDGGAGTTMYQKRAGSWVGIV